MAETVRTNTPFMPDMRKSPFKGVEEEVINRSESTASSQCNGTATPTLASIHLAPLNPPTRTPSRTSIKWNGRSVFISIPLDIRDDDGVDPASGRPPAWTKEQVLERLRKWEKLGYNIEARDAFESNGQSKEIYPEERIGPFDKSEVIVSIPDRRDWEAYVEALREEKLRALGVALGDQPAVPPIPLGVATPASFQSNTLSPSLAGPAIGTQFNHYSPAGTPQPGFPFPAHIQSPVIAPPNFGQFHIPRQSISFQGSIPGLPMPSPGQNDWESYNMPPTQVTPPFQVKGWSSPYGRGGSPVIPHVLNNSNGLNGAYGSGFEYSNGLSPTISDFAMPDNTFQNSAQAFVDRFQQQHQQMRRGSPLAHVREASVEESEPVLPRNKFVIEPQPENVQETKGPTIVEPIPKHHRNQPSVSLQREMQGVESDEHSPPTQETHKDIPEEDGAVDSAFVTNPASPAPQSYPDDPISFPDQPEMPSLEVDIHLGAELASNPDDDITDPETEIRERKDAALGGNNNVNINSIQPKKNIQESQPQDPFYNTKPHSRDNSQHYPRHPFLSSRTPADSFTLQAQLQHDYDSPDPIQHSAMAMLVAGDELHQNGGIGPLGLGNEHLSEDNRTNISEEIQTNPSLPGSPRRKYSVTAIGHHAHHISNSSNRSGWAVMDQAEPPKPPRIPEYKFDPTTPFSFTPNNFKPPTAQSKSFNVAAPTFMPSGLFGHNEAFNFMNNKPATFNPAVPDFTPKFPSLTPEIIKPPTVKKVIPIVRPPSRKETERAAEEEADPRDPKSQDGGRKRTRHEPVLSAEEKAEVQEAQEEQLYELDLTNKEKSEKVSGGEETGAQKIGGSVEMEAKDDEEEYEASEEEGVAEEEVDEEEEEEVSGEDDVDEVSSDEAEALMMKSPVEVVGSNEFNPYEFKSMNEMEFTIAHPSTTFDSGRAKNMRTPDTVEDDSLPDLSVDEAQFALTNSSLLEDQQSPPPAEDQPLPPPAAFRKPSLHPGTAPFSFDFKVPEAKPFIPQPLTIKTMGMAALKHASTPSPLHAAPPKAPPSILSPALSNPYSPAASPPLQEAGEEKLLSARGSPKKRPVPPDEELDDVFRTLSEADPPIINAHSPHQSEQGEDDGGEEEDQGLENEEEDLEDSLPWKHRIARRPRIPDFDKPTPQYGTYPKEHQRSKTPSPVPRHYRHRVASFSPDEVVIDVRPTVSSYKPPELPPVEKYRSTAIGITGKDLDNDWDDMVSEGGNTKLRPQSRLFFDSHVEELVGALLRTHVDPLEKSLDTIHGLLADLSNTRNVTQARRKFSTHTVESDADDEDEEGEDDISPRSPKRDQKMGKQIKAALLDALASTSLMHNPPVQREGVTSTAAPQSTDELKYTFIQATEDLEKKLDTNRIEVEEAIKEFQAILEKGQSGNMRMLMQTLHGLEDSLGEREKIILKATKALEDKLNENLNTRNKALEELSATLERGQSGSMTVITRTLNELEDTVNAKDNLVVRATTSLENKLNQFITSNNMAMDDVNNSLTSQLETMDESIQGTRKVIEDKAFWLNRNLMESSKNLEQKVVERQDNVLKIAQSLEHKLLDYSLITVENSRALETNLSKKNDAILETARSLRNQFDHTHSRQDVMLAETRAMAQRITEVTKSLEGKLHEKDKTIYEATKNLENRLYERDMAMVMDAREFIEERLKERDLVMLNVTKNLNDKLQNRDSAVIMDATRSLDERLQGRDRAVLEATKRLEQKLQSQDMSAVLEATKTLEQKLQERDSLFAQATNHLEEKLQERDSMFAQATSHLEEKLQMRDISVAEEIMDSLAARLKEREESVVEESWKSFDAKLRERDEALIEDSMKTYEQKLIKSSLDMTELRKSIERLINRDHESLVEVTQSLEDALKGRDMAMSAEVTRAFHSLEERLMERGNNDSLVIELKSAIEEILDKQTHILGDGHHASRVGVVEVEELQKRVGVLESLLEESRGTINIEATLRREAQEQAVELQTRLKLAEEERVRQKGIAAEAEKRLKALDDKRNQALAQSQMRSALLEGAHSSLQKSVSDLSARNAMLEGGLQEAKALGERLHGENLHVQNENKELRRTIETLRSEMEESIRVREGFRGKFNKLQEDMRIASAEINKEQARWARRDEEQKARIEVLEARLAAEAKSKEWLEREIERLRSEEREAIRLKVELEHVRRHGEKMESLSDKLRAENLEQQRSIAILHVDVETARQAARDEIARATATHHRDAQTANNEINIVRVSLEKQIEEARTEVDRVIQDAGVEKERHKLILEEAAEAHKAAFKEAKTVALQEQHRKYERQLEELRSQHERSLANAHEDAERDHATLRQNLNLARSQLEHYRERIAHLEDKLNVATTAAQAAAKAAREAKTSPVNGEARPSMAGEKVSPQALRESIVALQEQLGERAARVEELQQKLETVEKETSKKLRDSDFELSWLRELLGVRVNELEEITNALQAPTFNRETVRDAAVRLKANLQMEQQVRERGSHSTNGSTVDLSSSLANVAELAKQLPLAAAWGSWRGRGKAKQEDLSPSHTPAAPQSGSGFLSGFLTPPNVGNAQRLGSRLADLGSVNFSAKKIRSGLDLSEFASPALSARSQNERQQSAATPQSLLRRGSYDDDADVSVLGLGFSGQDDSGDFDVNDDEPPFKTAAYYRG